MKSRYVDPYVVCPFYAYEEASTARKIHCEGYAKGVHNQLYFKTKDLKKTHKKMFCKNADAYKKCPLYQGNSKYNKENKDEQIP